jgi:hypothetical protein
LIKNGYIFSIFNTLEIVYSKLVPKYIYDKDEYLSRC